MNHDMTFARVTLRTAILGFAATLALLPLGDAAQAESKLSAHYALSIASIPIGEGEWDVEIGKDRYSAKSNGRFFGAWRLILGSDIAASTRGMLAQARLAPAGYTANFSSDEEVEDVHMMFQNGAVSEFETKPPASVTPQLVPVSPTHLRGAVDPLTAGLVPVPGTGELLTPAACQHTLPIFDGSHRFDVTLSFKRMDNVKAESGYRGPAVVCGMIYRPIGGYIPGNFRVSYLERNHNMEMWFAPIAGTRLLAVVRITVPTAIGTAVLAATRFETGSR